MLRLTCLSRPLSRRPWCMPGVTAVPLAASGIGLLLSFLRCCLRLAESIQGRRRASGLLSLPGASPFWLRTPASQGAKYLTRLFFSRSFLGRLLVSLVPSLVGCSLFWLLFFFCRLVGSRFSVSALLQLLRACLRLFGLRRVPRGRHCVSAFARAPAFRRVGRARCRAPSRSWGVCVWQVVFVSYSLDLGSSDCVVTAPLTPQRVGDR